MKSLTDSTSQRISPWDLSQRLAAGERMQLVDVRTSEEYRQGHLPSALNIPVEQVRARLGDLRPDEPVVLICHSGTRASICKTQLDLHRADVFVLEGGTASWQRAGLGVVGGGAASLPIMRQVQIGAGTLILLGVVLSMTVHSAWIGLSAFVGAGLLFAGLTGFCGMAILLSRMPWNKRANQ